MSGCMSLALIVAVGLVSEPQAGKSYDGAWWNGVAYSEGEFKPADPASGPPRLVSHTAWRAEESPEGTIIRVGDGYLTADVERRKTGMAAPVSFSRRFGPETFNVTEPLACRLL